MGVWGLRPQRVQGRALAFLPQNQTLFRCHCRAVGGPAAGGGYGFGVLQGVGFAEEARVGGAVGEGDFADARGGGEVGYEFAKVGEGEGPEFHGDALAGEAWGVGEAWFGRGGGEGEE